MGSGGACPPRNLRYSCLAPRGWSGGLRPSGISVNYPCLASLGGRSPRIPVPCPRALPPSFFCVQIFSSQFFWSDFFRNFFRRNFFVGIFPLEFFRPMFFRPSSVRRPSVRRPYFLQCTTSAIYSERPLLLACPFQFLNLNLEALTVLTPPTSPDEFFYFRCLFRLLFIACK